MELFKDYKITLASASPRRRELLAGLDIEFTVECSKDEKEVYSEDLPWNEVPAFLALHKSESFHRPLETNEILITADTLVFLASEGGKMQILGKPRDYADASRVLGLLSGHTHQVLTGVCLRDASGRRRTFTASTAVTFDSLSEEEIEYYIKNYHPYDKAGAYGVQEWIGFAGISKIEGSYYNVMGLPVRMLYRELQEFVKR